MILLSIFEGKKFIYNIGNPNNEIKAEEVANLIIKITKKKKKNLKKTPYPNDYPSDEPRRRCPSIDIFKREFKYQPKITLKEGLKMFHDYAIKEFKKI